MAKSKITGKPDPAVFSPPISEPQSLASGTTKKTRTTVSRTSIRQISNHLHPVILLALLYRGFDELVSDPVSFLCRSIIPLAALQLALSIFTYTPTIPEVLRDLSTVSPSSNKSDASHSSHKAHKSTSRVPIQIRVYVSIISLLSTLLVGPVLISFVLILFGAALTSSLTETVLCATHLSLLVVYPLLYSYGFSTEKWTSLASFKQPIDSVYGAALGATIGAWSGAIPIPLDWDRQWQRWPVTIVIGAYGGFAIGKVLGGSILKARQLSA